MKSQTIEKALHLSKTNKQELQKVLDHYKKKEDIEKYNIAVFLIENLPYHKSNNYKWLDDKGNDIGFDELDYESLEIALDEFSKINDSINVTPEKFQQNDVEVVKAKLLIQNIDLAFKEWKSNPWSEQYDFNTFCEYILPYRSLTEPLNNWREDYLLLFETLKIKAGNTNDPVEICTLVIDYLKDFEFIRIRKEPLPLLGPKQLLFRRQGNCPDMANIVLFASRALGIAVTFDFTPHYGASSNRHFWNSVIDKNGIAVPFNGTNDGKGMPRIYHPTNKRLAKVFRATFSNQSKALPNLIPVDSIPKGFLKTSTQIDVTSEYVPVGSVRYPVNPRSKLEIGYVNVYNKGRWQIVDWGKIKGNRITFNNLGRDIVYLPSFYYNKKNNYAHFPVLLNKEGESKILKPNLKQRFAFEFSLDKSLIRDYKDFNSLDIEDGETYHLYYWSKGWKKIEDAVAQNKKVFLNNVPTNALLTLTPSKKDGFERVFTIDSATKKIDWY